MGITFGQSAPSQITVNLDAVFATSLPAMRKDLIDAIGTANPLYHDLVKGDQYRPQSGTYIDIPLMYSLAPMDSYDGDDELPSTPTDGITKAVYEWRQLAVPVRYNMKEVKQNKNRLVDLVMSKIKQGKMGMQEGFSVAMWQGAAADGGSLLNPRTSAVNGSSNIEPIGKLIQYDPTASLDVGNINQNTNTWWRNKTKTSSATTYDLFLNELNNIFNSTALGTGGKPKLVVMDQTTYELFTFALYQRYRATQPTDTNYPFENTIYKGAHVTMDERVPDVATPGVTAATKGTTYFINTEFFELTYEEDSDFDFLKDEGGKIFQKPTNGDSRLGHFAWMGNLDCSNRRKQGVLGNIARTLTA